MSAERKKLDGYTKYLKRQKYSFPCPICRNLILPKDFEKHCCAKHSLNPNRCCVWCFGDEKWDRGPKNVHADHLLVCSRKFLVRHKLDPAPAHPGDRVKPRLLDMEPMCRTRDFFEHEDIRGLLPPLAFELFNLLDHENRVDYFRDPDLNLAASYVRLFEETKGSSDWIHLMVRAVAFESFLTAVLSDPNVKFLPFSCWCDGGPYAETRFRQHRHLLVTCPRGHFRRRVWTAVKASDRPCRNFKCKILKFLSSPMHLINTLGYVSKRKSRCNFKVDGKKVGPLTDKHFYIFKSLPKEFCLPLSLQFENGLMGQMYQEKFKNVSMLRLIQSPLTFVDSKWRQKIEEFYGFEGGLVLPLHKLIFPLREKPKTREKRTPFCFLTTGRKLYLDFFSENESLDEESWLYKQIEGGNCFYDIVKEQIWTPRRRDQKILNTFLPIVKRNSDLESENVSLKCKFKEELNSLKRKHQEEILRLNEEKKRKLVELDQLKNEMKVKNDKLANSTCNPIIINNIFTNNKSNQE